MECHRPCGAATDPPVSESPAAAGVVLPVAAVVGVPPTDGAAFAVPNKLAPITPPTNAHAASAPPANTVRRFIK